MPVAKQDRLPIRIDADVVRVRRVVRQWAVECRFSLVDQTKMVTAASELTRNALDHGGGGEVVLDLLEEGNRRGLRLTFIDQGPGIADVELAMRDGYTTRGGLGLGLGGARRLVNEFHIETAPGEGTRVTIARWR